MRRAKALAALSLATAACGETGPEDWPEGRPRIDWLRFLQQEPTEPSKLQFALAFVDDDGDLGLAPGQVELHLQERLTATLATDELFSRQVPPLSSDAREGILELSVRIQQTIDPGTVIRVALQVIDAAGRRSNRPYIDLRAVGEEEGP